MATNYLKLGAERLQAQMESYGGVEVIYRRVGQFSFPITAVPGRNPVEITDSNGVLLRGQVQDFIFNIEALKASMHFPPKRPMRGDEIVSSLSGERVVYVVNGEGFAVSHYENADSYGVAWRVHTKSDRIYCA